LNREIAEKAKRAAYNQSIVAKSAVTFIWIAIPYRMTWRYGERGYRYLHLDVGHVCQNLYLSAENINCGVCAIAAFHDEEFNDLLGLNGQDQFVIYLATVGKKK
jgi:SagB-type dehydrogenase family enzyme